MHFVVIAWQQTWRYDTVLLKYGTERHALMFAKKYGMFVRYMVFVKVQVQYGT